MSQCNPTVHTTGFHSKHYFLNGFLNQSRNKSNSRVLSSLLFPCFHKQNKKNFKSQEIQNEDCKPLPVRSFSPHLPHSLVISRVSGVPTRSIPETWSYYIGLGSLETQRSELRQRLQFLTINVLTYFPFRQMPGNIINHILMFICFKYSILFNRQMRSFESRKE